MLSLSKGAAIAGVIGFGVAFAGCLMLSHKAARRPVLRLAGLWLGLTITVQAFFYFASPLPATADYFAGNAGNAALSRRHRLLVWQIAGEMATQHPLTGVGGNNFAALTNFARANLAARNTDNSSPEIAEDIVLERAHNEYLQILAELGAVGLLLFAAAFGAVKLNILKSLRKRNFRLAPMTWAGIGGLTAFAVSSLISSFSFRVVQNGIAFMLILGFVINRTAREKPTPSSRPSIAAFALLSLIAVVFFGTKAVGEYSVYRAERVEDVETAHGYMSNAIRLDPDNLNARYALGSGLATQGEYERAAFELRQAIDRGLGVSMTYAQLARLFRQSGDAAEAEKTFTEAVAIYPRSPYLRVEFAIFLEETGREADAGYMRAAARQIDEKQANGWYSLIKDGSTAAFMRSQNDKTVAPPADLVPGNAVRQYLDKLPWETE
jgi:tetratricopeptide (TPR) repeat protein